MPIKLDRLAKKDSGGEVPDIYFNIRFGLSWAYFQVLTHIKVNGLLLEVMLEQQVPTEQIQNHNDAENVEPEEEATRQPKYKGKY